jgi:CBS domain-containing protein
MRSAVKDVMSTHVIAVRPNASYKEMAVMMRDQRVSAFPVVDDSGKVIGVVSETDLLTKEALEGTVPSTLQAMAGQQVRAQVTGVIAAELMTSPVITIGPDEPVSHAARLMFNFRVKRLPVISPDGTLIGIVTRSDVLSVYRRTDGDIAQQVTEDVLDGTHQRDPSQFTVTVKNGIVTIEGAPETAVAGLDIVSAIRHMEGVVAVRDRLSYPAGATV